MGRTGGTGFYLYTYVRKFYFKKREGGKKNTSMHLEQCSKCGNRETCVRSRQGHEDWCPYRNSGQKIRTD